MANGRMLEIRPAPGNRPVLVNPKPYAPFRHAVFKDGRWQLGPELYGPQAEIQASPAEDVSAALAGLEDMVRAARGLCAVYYVRTNGSVRVGAVLLRLPLPVGYAPVAAHRPEPQ